MVPAIVSRTKLSVVSDAAVALYLLHAAIEAASFNIWINLKSISDEIFKKTHIMEMNQIKQQANVILRKEISHINPKLGITNLSSD